MSLEEYSRRDGDRLAPDGHQAMRAVCRAAGWEFCEEHQRPLRTAGCLHLHAPPEPEHEYWCEYPDRECICPPVRKP